MKFKLVFYLVLGFMFFACSEEGLVPQKSLYDQETEVNLSSRSGTYTVSGDSIIAEMVDTTAQFYTSGDTKTDFIDQFDLSGEMVDEFKDILGVVYDYHVAGTTGSQIIGTYNGSEVDDFYQYIIDNQVAEEEFYNVMGGGCVNCGPSAELFPWKKIAATLRLIADLIDIWVD